MTDNKNPAVALLEFERRIQTATSNREVAFRAVNAETQLVWGSNFPSHDFDVPATVYDLPFLDAKAKAAILGGNALKLFGIDPAQS